MKRIVYVSADWCGPCKTFKPILKDVTSKLKILVEYVNVDYDAKYVQEFRIHSIPTTLCFNDTILLWKKSGIISEPELKTLLAK